MAFPEKREHTLRKPDYPKTRQKKRRNVSNKLEKRRYKPRLGHSQNPYIGVCLPHRNECGKQTVKRTMYSYHG